MLARRPEDQREWSANRGEALRLDDLLGAPIVFDLTEPDAPRGLAARARVARARREQAADTLRGRKEWSSD